MIEDKEFNEQDLSKLIDIVERDPIPTNIFTDEPDDPLVLLGKMNEIEANLKGIRNVSSEAKTIAQNAQDDAIEAVIIANESNNTANNATTIATDAKNTATDAKNIAENAKSIAEDAKSVAENAKSIAEDAKSVAEIVTEEAISTANDAKNIAQDALEQVTEGLGTKVSRGTQLLSDYDIKPLEEAVDTTLPNEITEATKRGVKSIDNDCNIWELEDGIYYINKNAIKLYYNGKGYVSEYGTGTLFVSNRYNASGEYNNKHYYIFYAGVENAHPVYMGSSRDATSGNYKVINLDLENKADKSNTSQNITANTMTANTGDFTNINNSLTNIMTKLNKIKFDKLYTGNLGYHERATIPLGYDILILSTFLDNTITAHGLMIPAGECGVYSFITAKRPANNADLWINVELHNGNILYIQNCGYNNKTSNNLGKLKEVWGVKLG